MLKLLVHLFLNRLTWFQGIPDWKCSYCSRSVYSLWQIEGRGTRACLTNMARCPRQLGGERAHIPPAQAARTWGRCKLLSYSKFTLLLSILSAATESLFYRFFSHTHTQGQLKCRGECSRSCSRTSATASSTGITSMWCRLQRPSFSLYRPLG